mmetsp:Transcript_31151/g.72554  ORF Transcript_31151/g.72554 Transcript_31151/m.72554 type:complete len:228 (-) Transcript_31151:1498-2181(-)
MLLAAGRACVNAHWTVRLGGFWCLHCAQCTRMLLQALLLHLLHFICANCCCLRPLQLCILLALFFLFSLRDFRLLSVRIRHILHRLFMANKSLRSRAWLYGIKTPHRLRWHILREGLDDVAVGGFRLWPPRIHVGYGPCPWPSAAWQGWDCEAGTDHRASRRFASSSAAPWRANVPCTRQCKCAVSDVLCNCRCGDNHQVLWLRNCSCSCWPFLLCCHLNGIRVPRI